MNAYTDQLRIKANFSQAKVLVVENNDDHWLLMKQALQESLGEVGFTRVSTPEHTLKLLTEWQHQEWEIPKLILLDLCLPAREDGWRLVRQIKGLPYPFNLIPIIIQSLSDAKADITESYMLGISSYVTKPADYPGWLRYFQELRTYWWETVTLPPLRYKL